MKQSKINRKKKADERQEIYSKLTVKQKISKLDSRLGESVGAKKQRARLLNESKQNKKNNAKIR